MMYQFETATEVIFVVQPSVTDDLSEGLRVATTLERLWNVFTYIVVE